MSGFLTVDRLMIVFSDRNGGEWAVQLRWYLMGTAFITFYLFGIRGTALWVISSIVAWWQSKKSTDGGDGWVLSAGIVFAIMVGGMLYVRFRH